VYPRKGLGVRRTRNGEMEEPLALNGVWQRKKEGIFPVNYSKEAEELMKRLYQTLSEKDRRRYAAIEAFKLGHGGQKYICEVLGCDPATVKRGLEELQSEEKEAHPDRIRKPGGGNKKTTEKIRDIDKMFFEILKHHTAGSPMEEQIKWTNLRQKDISRAFHEKGYKVSSFVVKQLLKYHHFVKRKMQKVKTMKEVEHRNEQFETIKTQRDAYEQSGNPIISIDGKKKEALGNFYRNGAVYCTEPVEVYDHDFLSSAEGVVIPHGIYDVKRHEGYVTLGTSKDTSEFCCDCIRSWWLTYGIWQYPDASSMLILADGGGSNSSRQYIFKEDLQKLADELKIEIRIAHYPPYTSKFNPIEHKLFCHITNAWAGAIFTSLELVKELAEKTSAHGLKVFVSIKDKIYKTGRKASQGFKENMTIIKDDFLGQWNYRAVPATGAETSEVIF